MSRILSGLIALDNALGGGVPEGSLVEISGTTDSCKTALALWYCKTYQEKIREPVMWVCTEANLNLHNINWANLDLADLIIGWQTPEISALDIARMAVEEGIKLVVIDSVSALISGTPMTPLNNVIGARMPALYRAVTENDAIVLLTNQERTLPGTRAVYTTGNGRTLNRLLDVRVKLNRGENLYRGGIQVGTRINFSVQKNGEDISTWGYIGKFTCLWQGGLKDLKNVQKEEVDNGVG